MSRRLRAVVGNAIVWGGIWFVAGCMFYWLVRFVGLIHMADHTSFVNMIGTALRIGIAGAVASTVFSLLIGVLYKGRALRDISWMRFGLGGGVVSTAFILGMMFIPRWLGGEPILSPADWVGDAFITAVFGTIAAGGTMKVAQMADRSLPAATGDRRR
jgi:hypothetical protein